MWLMGVPMGEGITSLILMRLRALRVLKDASLPVPFMVVVPQMELLWLLLVREWKANLHSIFDMHYGVQEMKNPYNMADAVEYAEILNTAARPAIRGI